MISDASTTLSQHLEDMEGGYIALERIANPNRKLLSTIEVLKGLE